MGEPEITTGAKHQIQFFINGQEYTVSEKDKFDYESTLVDFIREEARLKGTKIMCREGGCGLCIVTVYGNDPKTEERFAKAVASCIVPLFTCDGWEISTIEHLGNKKRGYHPIQKSLVDHNAIQCGFCSPGMVMSMFSREVSKSEVSIEDCLDGNLCRCTGYRPIIDAFKSVSDMSPQLREKDCGSCQRSHDVPNLKTHCGTSSSSIELDLPDGRKYIKVDSLNTAFCVCSSLMSEDQPFKVVVGIHGKQGAFRDPPVKSYLDITGVQELLEYFVEPKNGMGVFIGSSVTLSKTISLLKEMSKNKGYEYTLQISKLLERDKNIPVRNTATLGGELMLRNRHKKYISDLFVFMEAAGATVTIATSTKSWKVYSLRQFLTIDMIGKFLVCLNILPLTENHNFRVFKISRRYQNSLAILNAGFLLKVDREDNYKVTEKPRIVFGGIRPNFVHAWGTEMFLLNKSLTDEATLQGAMKHLDSEIDPAEIPGRPSPYYRKSLTKSLLYKTILGIIFEAITDSRIKSGNADQSRQGPTTGTEDYGVGITKASGPLYEDAQRLDADILSAGEAEFTDDIPTIDCELFGAFVLTTIAKCELDSVDSSEALEMAGVVRFIDANDIPGENNYMTFGAGIPIVDVEPIFVFDEVHAAGQPVGVILATSREVAYEAARKVKITYKNVEKPIVTMREAYKKMEEEGTMGEHLQLVLKTPPLSVEIPTREISGVHEHGSQFHYSLEGQCCLCIPKEDSMDVFCATQWMDHVQSMIAIALGVDANYVNVTVRRLGGAFGSKITRATHTATACAVAAYTTNKPVRMILDMETNMKMIGKRDPYYCTYNVNFAETGKIVALKAILFCGPGWTKNEAYAALKLPYFQNVYAASNWTAKAGYLLTDTPANTYTRAPGGLNGIALIEYIMEHIAFVLKMDPFNVRAANYARFGDPLLIPGEFFDGENLIPRMVGQLQVTGEYEERKRAIEQFNKDNRWKKRGIGVSTSANIINYYANTYVAYVTIYHSDGTVAVSHSGIEFGTGVNIKVAQTVATYLDVPLSKVRIKPNNNLTGNNSGQSALSISSELNAYAAMQACKILLERLAPLRQQLQIPNPSLQQLAEVAFHTKVDLSASYMFGGPSDKSVKGYLTYQVVINEVEVDILTGEYKMVRVDILEDVGRSLNPLVDIGQLQGGFIFGSSLWSLEEIIFDEETGELLTDGAWSYKISETRDIPEDFRVALLANSGNRKGVMQTKASGEPPTNLGVSVLFAVKNAIDSARREVGNEDWVQINGPVTLEEVFRSSLTSSSDFTI